MNINNIRSEHDNLFIYEPATGKILFSTSRPYDIDFDITIDSDIRNARTVNFSKGDVFQVKSPSHEAWNKLRNGKDLYIPNTIIDVVSCVEKVALKHDGEIDYKNEYAIAFHVPVFHWVKHYERVTDLPANMPLNDYDPNGRWATGLGFDKNHTIYDTRTDKDGETIVVKRWLTYESIESATIDSDYYTRIERDTERTEREKIAEIISDCLYGNNHVSHYEVARMLEKLNISIKQ